MDFETKSRQKQATDFQVIIELIIEQLKRYSN